MKKNKVKKLIAKELARFDNRLFDVEVKTGIMPFEIRKDTFTNDVIGFIAVKDSEHIKLHEDKTEILPGKFVPKGVDAVIKQSPEPKMTHPELPAKWCMKVTPENIDVLSKWKKTTKYKDNADAYRYVRYDGSGCDFADGSYTEISFSDFERFVLKKAGSSKMESAEDKFQQGNWYTDGLGWTVYLDRYDDEKALIYGFKSSYNGGGFFKNAVCKSTFYSTGSALRLATKEEAEEALINEANKIGFKVGCKVKCLTLDNPIDEIKDFHWDFDFERNRLYMYGIYVKTLIFSNGIWAEIVSQPEEEIDWGKKGVLYYSMETGTTVLSTGISSADTFEGICVEAEERYKGDYSRDWIKEIFEPFKGEITLKNDN